MRPPIDRDAIAALTAGLARLHDPGETADRLALLRTLYAVGRRDLPLGRLFEGHVDALQIVARYGTPAQAADATAAARAGAVFGVWNADLSGDAARLDAGRLTGGKGFASGAGILTHAVVGVDVAAGRQLLLVDLGLTPPDIDRNWWRVTGMQRSETHIVRWIDAPIGTDALVGAPGDYIREPWFSGGALRFAAVQAGGVAALVDQTRDHLVALDRADDPRQRDRLADLYLAAQSAADAVRHAATAWDDGEIDDTLAAVAGARSAVYRAGETAIMLAQAAVGVQALFVRHPLAATLADLAMYLRQPGPDAQRDRLGGAVACGRMTPCL